MSGTDFWQRFDKACPDLGKDTVPLVKEILPKEKVLKLLTSNEPLMEEAFFTLVASFFRDAMNYGERKGRNDVIEGFEMYLDDSNK